MNEIKVYKFCKFYGCYKSFEAKLNDPNPFCIEHQKHLPDLIKKWLKSRSISMKYFRYYNQDGSIHCCRICGKEIYRKDHKIGHTIVCNTKECHQGNDNLYRQFNWNLLADKYLNCKSEEQKLKPIEFIIPYNYHDSYGEQTKNFDYYYGLIQCEECNKICINRNITTHEKREVKPYFIKLGFKDVPSCIAIHHKIPVYLMTAENYLLCWDISNLIALCSDCHSTKHTEVFKKIAQKRLMMKSERHSLMKDLNMIHYTSLDSFIENKSGEKND